MSWFEPTVTEIKNSKARLDAVEKRLDALERHQRALSVALLDYVQADLEASWVPAAKRLEFVLKDILK
jgi:hypothetical protein